MALSLQVYLTAEDLETLQGSMWLNIADEALLLTTAGMSWLLVRGITRGVLQRPSTST